MIDKESEEVLYTEITELINLLSSLKNDKGYLFFVDLVAVDYLDQKDTRFELVYHLLNMEEHKRIQVRVKVHDGDQVPSAVSLWKGCEWPENEAWELMGISIDGSVGKYRYLNSNFKGHPLRKDFKAEKGSVNFQKELLPEEESRNEICTATERGEYWKSVDPNHPALKDNLRILLLLKGEKVVKANCEVGFLHRGVEKLCETKTFSQLISYMERLNYHSSLLNSIGWCHSVEKAMGIEIPKRAQAMRMVLGEFSRIADHLMCISNSAMDGGAKKDYWLCLQMREKVLRVFELYSGARVMTGAIRIGGLSKDMPLGWVNECLSTVQHISKNIEEIKYSLMKGRLWMDRTRVGYTSAKEALSLGLSGPALRACGVNYDLRKTSPYYYYSDVDFKVPLGIKGDPYDRFLIRLEEIEQSLFIITQVLDYLPAGEILAKDPENSLCLDHNIRVKKGQWYHSIEAANGELGFHLISDDGESPFRLKIRSPSVSLCQAFSLMAKNKWYEETFSILHSLNIVAGELDR